MRPHFSALQNLYEVRTSETYKALCSCYIRHRPIGSKMSRIIVEIPPDWLMSRGIVSDWLVCLHWCCPIG